MPTLQSHDEKLDQLADAVKQGFDAVDKRFDAVEGRFDSIDKRFEKVDSRFDRVERRLDRMEGRMTIMEKDLAAIRFMVTELVTKDEFQKLEQRVEHLEQKLGVKGSGTSKRQ